MRKEKPQRTTRFSALKICTDPDCSHQGATQSAANFNGIGAMLGGGTVDVCKDCGARKLAATLERKRARAAEYHRLNRMGRI